MFRAFIFVAWIVRMDVFGQPTSINNFTVASLTATSNTTSNLPTAWDDPSNFIPLASDQAGKCNIFGPLCQTGTVTVSVNLQSTTTTTVVPCSSYLLAQASWVAPSSRSFDNAIEWPPLKTQISAWGSSFGRSPECTAFADAADPGVGNNFLASVSAPVLQGCPNNATGSLAPWESYMPPGILRTNGPHYFDCCDGCTLNVPRVRVLYFPDPSAPSCNTTNVTNSSVILSSVLPTSSGKHQERAETPVTAVYSGYTFTSPSIYIQAIGTANVTDLCGLVGAQYTNAIIALPSGGLSSYSWSVPVGGSFLYQANFLNADATKVVEISDLACPTWGIGTATPTGTGDANVVVGPPFNPLIEPPPELKKLDPQWVKYCQAFTTMDDHLASWAINDPPYALIPKTGLDPASTITSPNAIGTPTAIPIASPSPVAPQTSHGTVFQMTSKLDPVPGPSSTSDASQLPFESTQSSLVIVQSQDNPAPPLSSLSVVTKGSSSPIDPKSSLTANSAPQLGAVIYSVFGGNPITTAIDPQPGTDTVVTIGGTPITIQPSSVLIGSTIITQGDPAVTIAGTPITVNPSGVLIGTIAIAASASKAQIPGGQPFTAISGSAIAIAGTTLTADGPAITVSGSVYSVAPSGHLVIGAPGLVSAEVLAVGSETLTFNPSVIAVAGSTLTPGAPAMTIAGTPISLISAGIAQIGTATVTLNLPTPSIFTVAGQIITADPSAVVVDGTTITAGGTAVLISGTPVSLASGGELVIGTSTVDIHEISAAGTTTPSSLPMKPFQGAQSRVEARGAVRLGLLVVGVAAYVWI